MTETNTTPESAETETETVETETVETPEVTLENFEWEGGEDVAVDALVAKYLVAASAAQDSVNTVGKQKSVGDLIHTILKVEESPRDANIEKFRKYYDAVNAELLKAENAIREHIKSTYVGETSEEEITAAKEAFKKSRDNANAVVSVLESMFAFDSDVLPSLPTLRGTSASSNTGGGSGISRPRVTKITLDGEDVFVNVVDAKTKETVRKVTFTALKQALAKRSQSAETADLQSAALSELGVNDWAAAKDRTAEFSVGKHQVTVTV